MKTCAICRKPGPDLAAIDAALVRGTTLRTIAAQFGTSASALVRHKRHISGKVVENHRRAKAARVRDLRREVRVLLERALAFLDRAEGGQEARDAGVAFRETREALKLALQVDGELGPGGPQVNVGVAIRASPEFQQAVEDASNARIIAWVNGLPEPLRSMNLAHARQAKRARLDAETRRLAAEADAREPQAIFLDAPPSGNGQHDPGTGIRLDGDSMRAEALRLAEAAGWPTLSLQPGLLITQEEGWREFAAGAPNGDVVEALAALTIAFRGSQDSSDPQ